jgi:hypothetical protein
MSLFHADLTDNQEKPKASTVQYNFSMEVNEDFMRLYREAKELIGNLPASEIFRRSLKEFVEKRTTIKRKIVPSEPKNSRFIPKSTKLNVLKRDERQCTFVSKDGIRCKERHSLEVDHIEPYAFGGNNAADNLRLLCKSHNLLMAERAFGTQKIQQYFK